MNGFISSEEIQRRIIRLQERMSEKGMEIALILQNADLFYFSGTIQKGYLLVPLEGEQTLFVQKDYERALREIPLRCIRTESLRDLPGLMKENDLEGSRAGLELDVLPVSLFNRIKGIFKGWEASDISPEIKEIRSVKSDFEAGYIASGDCEGNSGRYSRHGG
jgi:Xaa-Pro dipeptidase